MRSPKRATVVLIALAAAALLAGGCRWTALVPPPRPLQLARGCRACRCSVRASAAAADDGLIEEWVDDGSDDDEGEADATPLLPASALPACGLGEPVRKGSVYYVSTPIGNVEDITLRALRTLREVDAVACEDTRVTARLLRQLGISRKRLISHHDHNLRASVPKLLECLTSSEPLSLAVVSDAGTPSVNDPGLALAAACAERGVPLVPVPGACAAVAAISVCGFVTAEWRYIGYPPRKGKERAAALGAVAEERGAVVFYEAPHRILQTLRDLAAAGAAARPCLCAREMTKRYEELHRGSVASAAEHYQRMLAAEPAGRLRGEFTVVVGPLAREEVQAQRARGEAQAMDEAAAMLREQLARRVPVSAAAKHVAAKLGVKKQKLYDLALELSREAKEGGSR